MSSAEPERDNHLVEVLDAVLAELRSGKTLDTATWQKRFPEVAQDLPDLLETLRDLDTSAETWKTGAVPHPYPPPSLGEGRGGGAPPTGDQLPPPEPERVPPLRLPEKIGRYSILERIGAGGMGTVYKAHDPELQRVVALKVPRIDRLGPEQPMARQRFLREARAAAQVRHAHVCPIHDVGEHDGLPFVVMAYVEGESLFKRLGERGRFDDLREAVELVRQVLEGLAAVHAHGIIHRDLKPGNILIDLSGQALLTDFGLAFPVNDAEHLTSTGMIVGTVAYMAPEQAAARAEAIGPWTDLYGLGVVLYQMVTGLLPFEGPPLNVLARITHDRPPAPSQFRPDLDPALEAIINKAMAYRTEERYQHAQEFAEALERWLAGMARTEPELVPSGLAVPARTPTPVVVRSDLPGGGTVSVSVQHGSTQPGKLTVKVSEQEFTKRRRRRRLAIQVSLAFAVVLAVVGYLQWPSPRTHEHLAGGLPKDGEQRLKDSVVEREKRQYALLGPKREPVPHPLLTDGQVGVRGIAPLIIADPEVAKADRDLVAQVSSRLSAVMDPLSESVSPTSFRIVKETQVNAFATGKIVHFSGTSIKQGDKVTVLPPKVDREIFLVRVVITSGLLDRVVRSKDDKEGEADRLAFILGHELGHVALGHIVRPPVGETAFLRQAFNRQQEIDADLKGMELALKAGYSFRRGRTAIDRMKQLGLNYSSFEGLGADHPSWNDRLALLDKDQAKLWKAMSAFETGTFFLHFEQYASAERCFREVVKEFPECYEALANRGDTLLMQYCDGLELDDLRRLDIGQIAIGAFYTRPESLEVQVRGVDEKLWKEAVEELEKALKLKNDLVLAKANLGVAYLVSPYGKDVKRASGYLNEVADKVISESSLSPFQRMTVLINASVADLAGGRRDSGELKLRQVANLGQRSVQTLPEAPVSADLFCALLDNRALSLAQSPEEAKRRAAVEVFEQYLKTANPASTWWNLAYERYEKLCRDLSLKVKPKEQLTNKDRGAFRPITSLKVAAGITVALSEQFEEVSASLGEGRAIPVVRGTKLVRVGYPDHGLELIAADRVMAIILRGPKAPELPLQGAGPGGEIKKLRLGMTKQELDEIMKKETYELRQLDEPAVSYRYYPDLGLAVRVQNDKVEELAIALLARRPVQEK